MSGFWELLIAKRGELLSQFIEHLDMTMMAVLIALLIGIPLAILITKNKVLSNIVLGVANTMQAIPTIAMLAFMVPFVGIGTTPAIIMVVVYALLPIIKNAYTGIMSIDPKTIEAAEGLGLTKWQQLIQIRLPIAAPFLMAGVRISAVTSVGTMTIAAFAGAGGLGWFINLGLNSNDARLVMLGAVPAALLALALDYLLAKVEQTLTPEGIKPPEKIVHLPQNKRILRGTVVGILCGALVLLPIGSRVAAVFEQERETVTVGGGAFTETFVLGELYAALIEENTDLKVERRFNLGTTTMLEALKSGDVDMFVSYTGTMLSNALHQTPSTDVEEVYQAVKNGMLEQYNAVVSAPIGFNNTYVMAVTPETAQKYNLKALSDLFAAAGQMRLGCTTSFVHLEDCLPKMQSQYNINFRQVSALQSNLRYQAIAAGEVDVVDAYSTDALLIKEGLQTLTDDMSFFPPYYAVNIVSQQTLKEYPELETLLAKMDSMLTDEEMGRLNYQVDVEGKDSAEVAHQWLKAKGLISQ